MIYKIGEVERAFQLASEGSCQRIDDIRRQLHREGYSGNHIIGNALRKQLKALLDARDMKVEDPHPDVSAGSGRESRES